MEGGSVSPAIAPRGIRDVAVNNNVAYARQQPVAMDSKATSGGTRAVLQNTTTKTTMLVYRWYVPVLSQRTTIDVKVYTETTGTGTATVYVETSQGEVSTAASAAGYVTLTPSIDLTSAQETIVIRLENSTATSFASAIDSVRVGLTRIAGGGTLTTTSVESDGHTPQDEGASSADRPMSVARMRELDDSVLNVVNECGRAVIFWCHPVLFHDTGGERLSPAGPYNTNKSGTYELLNEFIYQRRDYVTTLIVYATGFTASYVSSAAQYRLAWVGNGAADLEFSFPVDGTTLDIWDTDEVDQDSDGTKLWQVNGVNLSIPNEMGGPLRLRLYGRKGDGNGYLGSLQIFEKRPFSL